MNLSKLKKMLLLSLYFVLPLHVQSQVLINADLNGDEVVNISDVSFLINLIMGKNCDTAVSDGLCPDALHPHLIDLGLPSGTLWSCSNIGSSSPYGIGDYYAWGEMIPKDSYAMDTSIFYDKDNENLFNIGNEISKSSFDVAYVKWGSKYSIPSYYNIKELILNCTHEYVEINGVSGIKFTSSNGNSIFLPAGGMMGEDNNGDADYNCCYWSSSLWSNDSPHLLLYDGSNLFVNSDQLKYISRTNGLNIRPVKSNVVNNDNDITVLEGLCPDSNHPHVIDLGLESGTKWMCTNVGANYPHETGGYYAWGEIKEKTSYYQSNYAYYRTSYDYYSGQLLGSYTDIGNDIAGTKYDVVCEIYGEDYCMPSWNQVNELIEKCSFEMTSVNGVIGAKFKADNGHSIFLPAVGYKSGEQIVDSTTCGRYWSSTKKPNYSSSAGCLMFTNNDTESSVECMYLSKYYGLTIRGVSR